MDRYYVDDRCGCVAVRDRLNTDPDYQGLHADTRGVVKYWIKKLRTESRACQCCGHFTSVTFDTYFELEEAQELAEELNRSEEANTPIRDLFTQMIKDEK